MVRLTDCVCRLWDSLNPSLSLCQATVQSCLMYGTLRMLFTYLLIYLLT